MIIEFNLQRHNNFELWKVRIKVQKTYVDRNI